ncbi:hypothetical protein [Antrihabitans cavernicola]|uniref:Anti-sigma factor n=1 Tax=Antrihabitans cavernicola TaxID=2495913 RepID=A0A5A7SFR2_9NOCA|nr:hypothetical protein [Spelaeibacter cavernicola]KAA0024970.1 hypothetical protein FOY51_03385 [Spelaeibacter cavernicola]
MTTHPNKLLQPPFSVDLIADLHAENLPAGLAPQLWPLARRDPDASRILAALDRVTAELNALGGDQGVASTIPPEVANRLDRALGLLPSTVRPLEQARSRKAARWKYPAAAAASVAAVGALVFTTVDLRSTGPVPDTTAAVELGSDLPAATMLSAMGKNDAPGGLADKASLTQCLAANDIEGSRAVLGSTTVRYQGRNALLVLVAGVTPPKITALVVGPGCAPGDAQQLAMTDIG